MTKSLQSTLLMVILALAVISRAFLTPTQYKIAFVLFLAAYAGIIAFTSWKNRATSSRQELLFNGILVLAILVMVVYQFVTW